MKNVVIINSYANTVERRNVLIKCINQIKKLNLDVILISNYQDDEYIQNLTAHYIYDTDNFLLPKERSPLNWFADSYETIHLFHPGTSYIVYKNICTSITFANRLGYKLFFYLEYDAFISDEDLYCVNSIFEKLNNKNLWFCKLIDNFSNKEAYESRMFAGDTNFFVNNMTLVRSMQDWYTKLPFCNSSESLEYILPPMINKNSSSVYFEQLSIPDLFNKSDFDVFNSFSKINIVYNNEYKYEPILFIITNEGEYELYIDENFIFKKNCLKGSWIKHKLQFNKSEIRVQIFFNKKIVYDTIVNISNIDDLKFKAIRYKL